LAGTSPFAGRGDAPILYWFRATVAPVGGAPEAIRRDWVGVPLPVRDPHPAEGLLGYVGTDVADRTIRREIPDGVAVAPADALRLLRLFDRAESAAWWVTLLQARPNISSFVFRRSEGELLPPALAKMLYPELEGDAGG